MNCFMTYKFHVKLLNKNVGCFRYPGKTKKCRLITKNRAFIGCRLFPE